MSVFLGVEDLFGYIANELHYTKKELASILGTSVATVTKWEKYETIPSQEMYRRMLHFGKIMGVDCSEFTMEMYVTYVLSFVYEDDYSLIGEIDYTTNKAYIRRNADNTSKMIKLEELTNRKNDFF